jgi:hypothetical protein
MRAACGRARREPGRRHRAVAVKRGVIEAIAVADTEGADHRILLHRRGGGHEMGLGCRLRERRCNEDRRQDDRAGKPKAKRHRKIQSCWARHGYGHISLLINQTFSWEGGVACRAASGRPGSGRGPSGTDGQPKRLAETRAVAMEMGATRARSPDG